LIVSYQATARQLEALKSRWMVLGSPEADPAQRGQFVHACEDAISIENNAWMATWLEGTTTSRSSTGSSE
jgi:hypothetical protein